jgi:hypothetical protein
MRVVAFLAALALTGCSEGPSTPSPPALSGTWRIVSVQMASQPFQLFLPPERVYQATFEASRVSVRVDCNTCSGAFTNGPPAVIGPGLACTRASCGASDAVNSDVVTILVGSHEVSERLGQITLRSNRGTITLRQQ